MRLLNSLSYLFSFGLSNFNLYRAICKILCMKIVIEKITNHFSSQHRPLVLNLMF